MTQPTQPPRAGFSNVDAEANPQAYLRMLDLQHADPFKQRLKARCRELLALRPGLRVLDAGAGVGVDAVALAHEIVPGGEVVGVDFSQAMVAEATRRTAELGLPVRFVQGDAHALDFPAAAFDRCFAAGTFQHLADPPTSSPADIISRRCRDLTPTEIPEPPTIPEPAAHGRGKSAVFVRSLREEVIEASRLATASVPPTAS